VLVAKHDDPVPMIFDFGVAKAVTQRLTEKTVFTHFGQMIGTSRIHESSTVKRFAGLWGSEDLAGQDFCEHRTESVIALLHSLQYVGDFIFI
jgi:hypothetical protein